MSHEKFRVVEEYLNRCEATGVIDATQLTQLLYILSKEYGGDESKQVNLDMLYRLVVEEKQAVLDGLLPKLADDVQPKTNGEYIKFMKDIYSKLMNDDGNPPPLEPTIEKLREWAGSKGAVSIYNSFAIALATLPKDQLKKVLEVIAKSSDVNLKATAAAANKFGAGPAAVGLTFAHISIEAYDTVEQYWRGEISGKTCAREFTRAFATVLVGTVGGATGGAYLGGMIGPWGAVFGGIVGGSVGKYAVSHMVQHLMTNLFDRPKKEALDRAFRTIGLRHDASNDELNEQYNHLVAKYDPKKNGNNSKFVECQACFALIQVSKNNMWE